MPRISDTRKVIKRYLELNPDFNLHDPNQVEPFLTMLQDKGYPGTPEEHMKTLIEYKNIDS